MKKKAIENSSLLKEVAHDGKDLFVTFAQGGNEYRYLDVPEREYENMIKADSIGRYFSSNIKPNYIYKKVS